MPDPHAVNLLRQAFFLRDLDEAALTSLAEGLSRLAYPAGDDILPQGAAADGLYFVQEGLVEVVQRGRDGVETHLGTLGPGDTLGVVELVRRRPRLAAARALSACVLYRWDRADLAAFVKAHPTVLAGLKFAAEARLLAQRLRFRWLAPDETVHAVTRKHPVLLYQALTLPTLLILISLALTAAAASGLNAVYGWLAAGLGVAGAAYGAWQWVDWGNDYYLVTNKRVVWLEKVVGLYDSRREAPLHTVLSVTLRTDAVGRSVGYGDVIIRTYTGQITFRSLPNPQSMAALVETYWRRERLLQEQADKEALARSLHERLGPTAAPEAPAAGVLPIEAERPARDAGLDHWTFQVRFEADGVITYRKHWAVLFRGIAAPSALILLLAGLVGGRLAGWAEFPTRGSLLAVAVAALLILLGWWLYRYVDWANDIYQITPNQIVDITRRPLGEERREVAPLENILGTEVDRKGLLGLLLNFGDVIANVGTTQFVFQGVYDPVGVQQDIVRAQEAVRQRKREKEVGERRQEMVELLNLYHEEIAPRPPKGGRGGQS